MNTITFFVFACIVAIAIVVATLHVASHAYTHINNDTQSSTHHR